MEQPPIWKGIVDRALAALATGAVGWFLATSDMGQTKSDVRDLRAEVAAWKAQSTPRRTYLGDVGNRTEFLCNQSKECRARFQPLQVPE